MPRRNELQVATAVRRIRAYINANEGADVDAAIAFDERLKVGREAYLAEDDGSGGVEDVPFTPSAGVD